MGESDSRMSNPDNHFRIGGDCIVKILKAAAECKCDLCGGLLAKADQPLILLTAYQMPEKMGISSWKWDKPECMFQDLNNKQNKARVPVSQESER